jgi:uncharacterized iron-regulated membrane protein
MKWFQSSPQKLRHAVFQFHRYLGLLVGFVIVVVGFTGSLLVFHTEIEAALIDLQFGKVQPQGRLVAIDQILTTVRAEVRDRPDLEIGSLVSPKDASHPYQARIWNKETNQLTQIFVNPYTGQVLGKISESSSLMQQVLRLHYQLAAGEVGTKIVGIVALLLLLLSLTGIALWPGWRNLINGFKIKWNAHAKRLNFDIHKVAGIITATFLAFTAFTGFCWNFYDVAEPIIYAATFTPKQPEPESQPIPGTPAMNLGTILQIAETALPGGKVTWISIPNSPTAPFTIYKKFPQAMGDFDNSIYLDQFSGKVLRVKKGEEMLLGDRVLASFTPLHYGTFWGLPSRILYVFVGFAPMILLITGFVMWRHRRKTKQTTNPTTVPKSLSQPRS